MVLRNAEGAPSVEDLAVGINAVSSSIETAGYGERLLCAVFAFADAKERRIYFIYNYKRGFWYPFVPDPRARPGARHRARAAAQGADGVGDADRARDRALVPAVGDTDLGGLRAPFGLRRSGPARRAHVEGARRDGRRPAGRTARRASRGSGPRR